MKPTVFVAAAMLVVGCGDKTYVEPCSATEMLGGRSWTNQLTGDVIRFNAGQATLVRLDGSQSIITIGRADWGRHVADCSPYELQQGWELVSLGGSSGNYALHLTALERMRFTGTASASAAFSALNEVTGREESFDPPAVAIVSMDGSRLEAELSVDVDTLPEGAVVPLNIIGRMQRSGGFQTDLDLSFEFEFDRSVPGAPATGRLVADASMHPPRCPDQE